MQPVFETEPIREVPGDDWIWPIELLGDDDEPIDLTGCSFDGAALVWGGGSLPLTPDNGRLGIDPTAGAVTISIARAATSALPAHRGLRLVLPIVDSQDRRSTLLVIPVRDHIAMTQPIRTVRITAQGPAGAPGIIPRSAWSAEFVPYHASTVLSHESKLWLALRDTSVEPSGAVPDDWVVWIELGDLLDGVASLDGNGKIQAAQLPALAITDTFTAASQSAMLALDAQKGDIAIRTDLNKSFVLASNSPTTLADWKELLTPTDAVLSVAGRSGAVTMAQADIAGLTTASTPAFAGTSLVGGTVTASTPVLSATQTWNNGATTFTAVDVNVTSTAAASTSKLLDLRVGGASRLAVSSAGAVTASGTLRTDAQGSVSSPALNIVVSTASNGFYIPTGGTMTSVINGVQGPSFSSLAVRQASNGFFGWSAGSSDAGSDTLLKRAAAGAVQVRTASDAAFGTLQAKLATDTNAVTETITPNKTLTLYDAAGVAYKVPCVAA